MLIQACLNGSRTREEHGALPLSPEDVAADAHAVVRAGARSVHLHPRRPDGAESLDPVDVAAVCTAVRQATPHLSVGVTTAAWIEPDVDRRMELIERWSVVPDFASVNLSENGSSQVIDLLNARGIGVEAGVWTIEDARLLIHEGLDSACLRVLVEVEMESEPARAVSLARAIDFVLDDGLSQAPRLHHGGGIATWAVIAQAISHGHDVRIGLEDTLVLEDGSAAADNESLVAAVADRARAAGRNIDV